MADIMAKLATAKRAFERNINSTTRTATFASTSAMREAVYSANKDLIEGVMFTAVLDGRTTDYCKSQDGKIAWIPPKEAEDNRRPPFHVNCRTIAVPVLEGEEEDVREELKFRSQVAAGDSYEKGDNIVKGTRSGINSGKVQIKGAERKTGSSASYGDFLRVQAGSKEGQFFIKDVLGKEWGEKFIEEMKAATKGQRARPLFAQKKLDALLKKKQESLSLKQLRRRENK
jgi:SPP1 gp7 family putative phage head morphogenesis protein